MWPFSLFSRKNADAVVESHDYRQQYYRRLNAKYDLAQTTDENERHWANADYLSPNRSNSHAVRRKMRARARYEVIENNSYAKGMVLSLANDTIGTGPRLQFLEGSKEQQKRVQRAFANWADEVCLAEKLRTLRVSKAVDGEAFAMFVTNQGLKSNVKLDLRTFEADHVASDVISAMFDEQKEVDGIRFDSWQNPAEYHILKKHPGAGTVAMHGDGAWVSAEQVIHLFRADRPGQRRGVTEFRTCLPLFAMLRRFTLATVAAAETAASFAGVMRTNSSALTEAQNLAKDEWFEAIPIEHRALLTLPNGWDITQFRAEHPASTFEMFRREIINEVSRCLNMPYNIAAANSGTSNFSSANLDHRLYYRSLEIEQDYWETRCIDRVFYAWLDEAMLTGLLDGIPGEFAEWRWRWFWDKPTSEDVLKRANAVEVMLRTKQTTLQKVWSDMYGEDWEDGLDQWASEYERQAERGLPVDNSNGGNGAQDSQSEDAPTANAA